MSRKIIAAVFAAFLLLCTHGAFGREPLRIDGTSDESAQASYTKMARGLSSEGKMALALAVLKLNMEGINSAYEMLNTPGASNPSITRIRERVNGMTAQEIIALSETVQGIQVEAMPATPPATPTQQ